jgi:hypothetical protein
MEARYERKSEEEISIHARPVDCAYGDSNTWWPSRCGPAPSVRKDSHVVAGVGRFLDERLNHAKCPEAEANARLIASAPDLYAALDRIVDESPTPSEAAMTIARKVLADAIAD